MPTFDTPDTRLRREIGVAGAIFIAFNGVIGAGIFGAPGRLYDALGAWSPFAFLAFGVLFLPIITAFGALANRFQSTGGPSLYAAEAFGPTTAYFTGWVDYVSRATVGAANSNVLILYIAALTAIELTGAAKALFVLVFYGSIAALNISGVKNAVGALRWFAVLKAAPLLLLALFGLTQINAGFSFGDVALEMDSTTAAALLVFYAFIGFESVNLPAGETKDPQHTIKRGMLSVFLFAIALYFLIQLSYVLVVGGNGTGAQNSGDAPLAHMAAMLIGPAGAIIITAIAVASITGNLIVNSLGGPRITFAIARQGSIPSWFAGVSEKFHTPQNSILFYASLVIVLAATGTFVWLATAGILARMSVYLISIAALIKLQLSDKEKETDDKSRRTVLAAAGFSVLVCLFILAAAPLSSWAPLAGILALSVVLRFAVKLFGGGRRAPLPKS